MKIREIIETIEVTVALGVLTLILLLTGKDLDVLDGGDS